MALIVLDSEAHIVNKLCYFQCRDQNTVGVAPHDTWGKKDRAVIIRRGPGISPSYKERGPRLFS